MVRLLDRSDVGATVSASLHGAAGGYGSSKSARGANKLESALTVSRLEEVARLHAQATRERGEVAIAVRALNEQVSTKCGDATYCPCFAQLPFTVYMSLRALLLAPQ